MAKISKPLISGVSVSYNVKNEQDIQFLFSEEEATFHQQGSTLIIEFNDGSALTLYNFFSSNAFVGFADGSSYTTQSFIQESMENPIQAATNYLETPSSYSSATHSTPESHFNASTGTSSRPQSFDNRLDIAPAGGPAMRGTTRVYQEPSLDEAMEMNYPRTQTTMLTRNEQDVLREQYSTPSTVNNIDSSFTQAMSENIQYGSNFMEVAGEVIGMSSLDTNYYAPYPQERFVNPYRNIPQQRIRVRSYRGQSPEYEEEYIDDYTEQQEYLLFTNTEAQNLQQSGGIGEYRDASQAQSIEYTQALGLAEINTDLQGFNASHTSREDSLTKYSIHDSAIATQPTSPNIPIAPPSITINANKNVGAWDRITSQDALLPEVNIVTQVGISSVSLSITMHQGDTLTLSNGTVITLSSSGSVVIDGITITYSVDSNNLLSLSISSESGVCDTATLQNILSQLHYWNEDFGKNPSLDTGNRDGLLVINQSDNQSVQTTITLEYRDKVSGTFIAEATSNSYYYQGSDASDSVDLSLSSGSNLIVGGAGDNTLIGGSGSDVIVVGGSVNGNDIPSIDNPLATGSSIVNAGSGNDTIIGSAGSNKIDAGDGDDLIFGGPISVDANNKPIWNSTVAGNSASNTIVGGAGNNTIIAGTQGDLIYGNIQEDTTTTTNTGGNNLIYSGIGNDTIHAGGGNNTIILTDGTNHAYTGAGADSIHILGGINTIYAGDGTNSIQAENGTNNITTGSGNDSIQIGGGNATINTGNGNNSLSLSGTTSITAGSGNDSIHIVSGSHTVYAGDGADSIFISDGTNKIEAGNGNNVIQVENGNNNITAGSGNDSISITNGNSTIHVGDGKNTLSLAGNTSITAGNGDDSIHITNGNHTIHAGDGNNTLTVQNGSTSFTGGSGSDVITISGGQNHSINTGSGNDSIFISSGTGHLTTGHGNNRIEVSGGSIKIDSHDGNDTFYLSGGNSQISTGLGSDKVVISGDYTGSIKFGSGKGDVIAIDNSSVSLDKFSVSEAEAIYYSSTQGGTYNLSASSLAQMASGGDNFVTLKLGNTLLNSNQVFLSGATDFNGRVNVTGLDGKAAICATMTLKGVTVYAVTFGKEGNVVLVPEHFADNLYFNNMSVKDMVNTKQYDVSKYTSTVIQDGNINELDKVITGQEFRSSSSLRTIQEDNEDSSEPYFETGNMSSSTSDDTEDNSIEHTTIESIQTESSIQSLSAPSQPIQLNRGMTLPAAPVNTVEKNIESQEQEEQSEEILDFNKIELITSTQQSESTTEGHTETTLQLHEVLSSESHTALTTNSSDSNATLDSIALFTPPVENTQPSSEIASVSVERSLGDILMDVQIQTDTHTNGLS